MSELGATSPSQIGVAAAAAPTSIPKFELDPPSGSYSAPVKVTLIGPPQHGLNAAGDKIAAASQASWNISIEHIDRVEEVFDGPSAAKHPPSKSIFVYEGSFRVMRAGRMRVCAWPVNGSYDTDRIVAIYFVDNPSDAAASRGWTVVNCPPSSVTHPITSFQPFSFELSAAQRYLRPAAGATDGSAVQTYTLPASLDLCWTYDRQVRAQEQAASGGGILRGSGRNSPPGHSGGGRGGSVHFEPQTVFRGETFVKAEISTTWEWNRGIRWSNDTAEEDVDQRYCIRVGREGGFTKSHGIHGEWDAAVTTEAALPVPVQFDVTILGAVNAVFGIHSDELATPLGGAAAATSSGKSSGGWKAMDISLHLASLSGSDEKPQIMFRFFSHHPAPTAVRKPIFEGSVSVNATLSLRVVPDTAGAVKNFCEVKLFSDGEYIASGFFPKRSTVKASCIISDPVGYSALQIVPRAPTTHLKVTNVFFGAAPLGSALDDRRSVLHQHIQRDIESARLTTGTDAAHADPECRVLFVDIGVDISPIESIPGIDAAHVPLAVHWRPMWMNTLPRWSINVISTAAQGVLGLFSLESGRSVESFEEAHERNKTSPLLMQL